MRSTLTTKNPLQDQFPSPRLPRLKGSILRPSLFNVPQPRLDPQPVKTSMMIRNRIRARENRKAKQLLHMQYVRDMTEEFRFWERLGVDGNEMRGRPGRKKGSGELVKTSFRESCRDFRVGMIDADLMTFSRPSSRDTPRAITALRRGLQTRCGQSCHESPTRDDQAGRACEKGHSQIKAETSSRAESCPGDCTSGRCRPGRAKIIE